MFKVRKLDLEVGGTPVAVMNRADCEAMNLNLGDRIKISWNEHGVLAVLDVSERLINVGEIGISADIWRNYDVPDSVRVTPAEKPKSVGYIRKRLFGHPLKPEEIKEIIKDIMENKLSSIEASFFVASAYVQRLSFEEEEALARAVIEAGKTLKWDKHPVLDKHCIGGVPGNRVTPIIVPIIAAAGYYIPKTSSKAITSPAGTADVIEVFAKIALPAEEIQRIVKKTNGVMAWGGGVNLAPADDVLLRLRYPLRLDPVSFVLASVLAKKAAAGADKVLIDIPFGAKVKKMDEARELADRFKFLGKKLGMDVEVIITDGTQPIGRGIGPSLEAIDVLKVLMGEGPSDLKEKALKMAGILLEMAGEKNGYEKAKEILESGDAHKKFKEIIKEQGGNPNIKPEDIPIGVKRAEIKAPADMRVLYDSEVIAKACRYAGAPFVKEAGMYLHFAPGSKVSKGETVITLYAPDEYRLKAAMDFLKERSPLLAKRVIIERI